MKIPKRAVSALLALCLLAVPAAAFEQTEGQNEFRVTFDAQDRSGSFDLSCGSPDTGIESTFNIGDDTYYAVSADTPISVTNVNPSEIAFAYVYCQVYRPMDTLTAADGQTIPVPGGYFADLSREQFYLGADGAWTQAAHGQWLLGQVLDADGAPGLLLKSGESCTFTLPDCGSDAVYLLCFFYVDQTITDYTGGDYDFTFVLCYNLTVEPSGFTDVSADDYFAQAVDWSVRTGVTSGTSPTTFSPADTVTRAQAVSFLWRAAGSPEPASAESPFTDVSDPAAYYYKPVLWAVEQGITSGVGGGLFDPNGTLPYDQIFAFLCRAAGGTSTGADWSADAIRWAADNGLTDGLTFTAKADCPRADVVYCLFKQLA